MRWRLSRESGSPPSRLAARLSCQVCGSKSPARQSPVNAELRVRRVVGRRTIRGRGGSESTGARDRSVRSARSTGRRRHRRRPRSPGGSSRRRPRRHSAGFILPVVVRRSSCIGPNAFKACVSVDPRAASWYGRRRLGFAHARFQADNAYCCLLARAWWAPLSSLRDL